MRERTFIQDLKRWLMHATLVLVSLFSVHLTMDGETADSLYRVFSDCEASEKPAVVNAIAKHLHDQGIIDTLYQCSTATKPNDMEALLHYLMAEHNYDQGLYEAALQEAEQAYQLTNRNKASKFQSDMLGSLSNAQYRLGKYDDALKTLLEAYKLDKKMGKKDLISSDLNTLAAIYLAVEQPEPGITYIEKAIDIERELNRPDRIATRLGLASELYLLNNEPHKAMEAINEAYGIDKRIGDAKKAAIRLVQKGAILESMSRLNEARTAIMQALPVLEEANINYSLAVAYNQLGSIEEKTGNHQQAADYYKNALAHSIKCGSPKTERIAERGLWESMRTINPTIALLHLERYTAINDSLYNKLTLTQIKVIETTDQMSDQNEEIKKKEHFLNMLKWGGIILVTMLIAMLAGLYYSWRRSQKALKMKRQTEDIKSHFFTNISNELQTPLTVVMNAGQQLLEGGRLNADENKKLGSLIVSHGKNMLNLVNQLLDIEKVRTSIEQPEYKEGDIVIFVRMLVDNYRDKAHQHLINLDFTSPFKHLMVVFVPDYVRKIVHGLIVNAIKFTGRNGSVQVKLTSPDNDTIRLTVSDTGKGIPLEEQERIFEPFSQSVNGDEGVETGIGLSLVNHLVQAMNGNLQFDSTLGEGTTFTIDIPVQIIDHQDTANDDNIHRFAERRIRQAGQAKHRPLVFIVENNEDVAFFIASHLREEYDLRFANDGREALQNAQDLVPDLVITNMMMPVMDGKELITRLRSNPALNHIPVIAMTSVMGEQERMECLKAGADAVLVKPFNSGEMLLIAKHLIDQRAVLRERFVKTSQEISQDDSSNQMSKEDKEFINRLVDVIHAQMAKDDIDMEHIAAALSMSRKQLRSRVMALTGLTPVAYVLQVRLYYARRMITHEDTSLTIIARKCGFQNLSHFSKAFKQQFGVSPMQFRKNIDDISQHPSKN